MLSVNAGITVVVVVLTPVSLLVANFIAKRTYSMFKLQSKTRGEQTALINEMIENQKVVQAYGQEEKVQMRFDEINDRLREMLSAGDVFLLHHESVDAVCQQPCVYGSRPDRRVCGSTRGDDCWTALCIFVLCESVYEAI